MGGGVGAHASKQLPYYYERTSKLCSNVVVLLVTNWGQLLLKVSGLIKNAWRRSRAGERGEGRGKETASISLAFLCVEKCIKKCGQRERQRQRHPPQIALITWIIDKIAVLPPAPSPLPYGTSFAIYMALMTSSFGSTNDTHVLACIRIGGGGGGRLIIFALSAQFVAFLRRLART